MLESGTPQALLWPLILTWTLSVSVLPATWSVHWRSACVTFGLDEASYSARLDGLDHFLDTIEALLDQQAAGHGL